MTLDLVEMYVECVPTRKVAANTMRHCQISDLAVVLAAGMSCQVRCVSVAISEAEAHSRYFLQSLVIHGLSGVKLVFVDDHTGLKNARKVVFGGTPRQRCKFYLQQNRRSLNKEVAQDLRGVFNSSDRLAVESYQKQLIWKYECSAWQCATVSK